MAAPKRTKVIKSAASSPSSPAPADAVTQASSAFGSQFQKLIEAHHVESARLKKNGHLEAAAIVNQIAHRLSSATNLDELLLALNEAADLSKWLPSTDDWRRMSRGVRKAKLVVAIHDQEFDPNSKGLLLSLLQKPGRPAETRAMAIPALELRRQGFGWDEIEERLLTHRRHAINPGLSIYREVQFLRRTLRRYGLRLENL